MFTSWRGDPGGRLWWKSRHRDWQTGGHGGVAGWGKVRDSRCWPCCGEVEGCRSSLLINGKATCWEMPPVGGIRMEESSGSQSCGNGAEKGMRAERSWWPFSLTSSWPATLDVWVEEAHHPGMGCWEAGIYPGLPRTGEFPGTEDF